jgi:membrane protein
MQNEGLSAMRRVFAIIVDAYWHFLADDGWAIASHIALSVLMAMFPFFIVLTSLAAFFGSGDLADQVASLLLATWPEEVAVPITQEIHKVLTTAHKGALTFGAVLAVFFASSGVESLRIGLNRAYAVIENRNWILLRLESIGYVLVAALGLLALGFLIVLGPLLFRTLLRQAPELQATWLQATGLQAPWLQLTWLQAIWLESLDETTFTFFRFTIASIVLVIALVVAHKWLAAGRRAMREIIPGIVATLILWLVTGAGFGRYLAEFSFTYVNTYAGLASAMIALVFLYWTASIFVYGGELNAAHLRARTPQTKAGAAQDDT